jgi:hypothetical protein
VRFYRVLYCVSCSECYFYLCFFKEFFNFPFFFSPCVKVAHLVFRCYGSVFMLCSCWLGYFLSRFILYSLLCSVSVMMFNSLFFAPPVWGLVGHTDDIYCVKKLRWELDWTGSMSGSVMDFAVNQHDGSDGNESDSCSGSARLESGLGLRLSWLRLLKVYLSSFRQIPG